MTCPVLSIVQDRAHAYIEHTFCLENDVVCGEITVLIYDQCRSCEHIENLRVVKHG